MITTAAKMSSQRTTLVTPLPDSRDVFAHVPLRTSALEPHSPSLNPWIDLKRLTLNIIIAHARTRNIDLTATRRRQESKPELRQLLPKGWTRVASEPGRLARRQWRSLTRISGGGPMTKKKIIWTTATNSRRAIISSLTKHSTRATLLCFSLLFSSLSRVE